MSILEDRVEERYPLPHDDQAIIHISRLELERMRRTAFMAGWREAEARRESVR